VNPETHDTEPTAAASEWEPVIGLEVHVQLATKTKAFSASAVEFGAPPNSLTDPLVLGLPGTLPVFNRAAVELALKLGVATESKIRAKSRFARKHYFYPDQPKGYQISQYDEPLCEDGHLDLILGGALNIAGLVRIDLPGWLLVMSYAVVGWRIGLHFTHDIVRAAARALPRILLSIVLLIGFSALLGLLLAKLGGVDPVTAYLATSPGGMDSVAIIAASTKVDVPFVMALQALRFFACVVAGPVLARFIVQRQRAVSA